jgi:phosphonate degradation associated HDIG domain protein
MSLDAFRKARISFLSVIFNPMSRRVSWGWGLGFPRACDWREVNAMLEIDSVEALFDLLASQGGGAYFGEPVTVLEHCLQAAHFAAEAGSAPTLVAAALLHDVGHLLHTEGEDAADHGLDTRHEELGDQLLRAHLPPSVTEPIRLHVAAKRYLCHADAGYLGELSPSSVLSLGLQGGPMPDEEAMEFLAGPFGLEAILLRRWDDAAKIRDLDVPGLETYLPLVNSVWW